MGESLTQQAKLSFVIIEYFSILEIKECIYSIYDTCKNFDIEIIVSSNSQYDEDQRKNILSEFIDIKWCFNPINGGFAYGMNQGLKIASGDYLIMMNPDVQIKEGLSNIFELFTINPQIGAIGPKIIDNKGILQDSCRNYLSIQNFFIRQLKRLILSEDVVYDSEINYNKIETVDWIIGAFIILRKETFDIVNGLDDSYFMYAEDLDLCTRIRQNGYEILYAPNIKVIYKGSRSARKSKKYAKIFLLSHLRYWRKFGFFYGYPQRKTLANIKY